MKIVFQHDGILPVKTYGGVERILYWLMKDLRRLGHQVSLIGHPQSAVSHLGIKLIPYLHPSQGGKDNDWRPLIPKDADIIHLFCSPPYPLDKPCIISIGGNGKHGELFHPNTVFVSRQHATIHGSHQYIYNAIDFDDYPHPTFAALKGQQKPWDNFLFLAKASWKVKNLKDCVWACRKSRRHLHIAGGRSWWPSRWIHSYGMVDQQHKGQLLTQCAGLLFPVRWHEPFGIAIIEAFAFGLPVIGSPYGSLPELITPETGIICQNRTELLQNLQKPPRTFASEKIWQYAHDLFSIRVMTQQYLLRYEKILQGQSLNVATPTYQLKIPAQELLPF